MYCNNTHNLHKSNTDLQPIPDTKIITKKHINRQTAPGTVHTFTITQWKWHTAITAEQQVHACKWSRWILYCPNTTGMPLPKKSWNEVVPKHCQAQWPHKEDAIGPYRKCRSKLTILHNSHRDRKWMNEFFMEPAHLIIMDNKPLNGSSLTKYCTDQSMSKPAGMWHAKRSHSICRPSDTVCMHLQMFLSLPLFTCSQNFIKIHP